MCFKTLQNNSLIWFQLKILYRILGTHQYLHKIGLSDSPICSRCNNTSESILHRLAQCNESKNFWISLENLIYDKAKFKTSGPRPASMWSGEFVSTRTGSPAQGQKFTNANPPVHDLSLLVLKSFYTHTTWSSSGLDVLNIAQTYLFVTCDSFDEILSATMGSCKTKILNEFRYDFNST